jgi:putative hydrolase of the HAD superfamily
MKTVLLDLGNVVLGIDFHRVFASWAETAGVEKERFYANWELEEAYKAHEIGAITFDEYCETLRRMFEVDLTVDEWRAGWNALWTQPFASVIDLLPELKTQYRLYAFTNTNDTHATCWRARYGGELASFEHIFVSSEIGARKPDPASFHQVCRDMACNPDDVVFLDDTKENVHGALEAGMDARHVAGESAVYGELSALL